MAFAGVTQSAEEEPTGGVTLDILELRRSSDASNVLVEGEFEAPLENGAVLIELDIEYLSKDRTFETLDVEGAYHHSPTDGVTVVLGSRVEASEGETLLSGLVGIELEGPNNTMFEASALLSVAPLLRFGAAREFELASNWSFTPFVDIELPLASEESQERFSQDELLEFGAVLDFEGDDNALDIELTADVLADEPSLATECEDALIFVDSSIVKAHRSAAGAKGGSFRRVLDAHAAVAAVRFTQLSMA